MTAVPTAADPGADGPEAGYYPDPSIPGYVRYWDGLGWTPGTSRPAPAEGEELPTPRAAARSSAPSMRFVPPPVPQRLLPPIEAELDQSGPIFLDETGPLPEPRTEWYPAASAALAAEPEPAREPEPEPEPVREPDVAALAEQVALADGGGSRWVADAQQQRGLLETGLAPRWVSWGASTGGAVEESPAVLQPRAEPEPTPVSAVAPDPVRAADSALLPAPAPAEPRSPAPLWLEPSAGPPVPPQPPVPPLSAAAAVRSEPQRAPAVAYPPAPAPAAAAAPAPAVPAPAPAPLAAPQPAPRPLRTASGPVPAPAPQPAPGPSASAPAARSGAASARAAAPAAPSVPSRRVVRTVTPRPALLGRRLVARVFDVVVVLGIVGGVGAQVVQRAVAHVQDKIDAAALRPGETRVWLLDQQTLTDLGLLVLGLLAVGLLYEALPTALWGRTLGKALFGLRVLDRRSKQKPGFGGSLARWLSYQVMLLLAVGVLDLMWCMVDRPWRQCWHDKIGRTFVVSARAGASRER